MKRLFCLLLACVLLLPSVSAAAGETPSGIRVLLSTQKKMKAAHGAMHLTNVGKCVMDIFVFPIRCASSPVQNPGVKTPGFFSRSRMVTEVMPYVLINI